MLTHKAALTEYSHEQEEHILTLMRDQRRRSSSDPEADTSLLAEMQGSACAGSCLAANDLRAQLAHMAKV